MLKVAVFVLSVIVVAQAQRGGARVRPVEDGVRQTTTPVPILRQINKVEEDGSYTYGYEAADGSYKIETKSKAGEVRGKYGYYDDTGALREIEYGASRQGFHPQGTDVRAPQAALAMAHDPIDDSGFYDPERYERPFAYDRNSYQAEQQQDQFQQRRPAGRRPGGRRQQKQFTLPEPAPVSYAQQQPQRHHVVNHQAPAPVSYQQPQQQQHVVNYQAAPAPPQQNYYQPQAPQQAPFNPQQFHGHPARNIDINTGSYSVQYHG